MWQPNPRPLPLLSHSGGKASRSLLQLPASLRVFALVSVCVFLQTSALCCPPGMRGGKGSLVHSLADHCGHEAPEVPWWWCEGRVILKPAPICLLNGGLVAGWTPWLLPSSLPESPVLTTYMDCQLHACCFVFVSFLYIKYALSVFHKHYLTPATQSNSFLLEQFMHAAAM